MLKANNNYLKLNNNYLFAKIASEKKKYLEKCNLPLIDLSIGDVTLPIVNSAKKGNKELINLLIDVVNENNVDIQEDSLSIIHDIILEYKVLCEHLRKDYVVGDLDTFKMASCMMVAVNKHGFTEDKFVNASIAVDTAYKMCEKPYTNIKKILQ